MLTTPWCDGTSAYRGGLLVGSSDRVQGGPEPKPGTPKIVRYSAATCGSCWASATQKGFTDAWVGTPCARMVARDPRPHGALVRGIEPYGGGRPGGGPLPRPRREVPLMTRGRCAAVVDDPRARGWRLLGDPVRIGERRHHKENQAAGREQSQPQLCYSSAHVPRHVNSRPFQRSRSGIFSVKQDFPPTIPNFFYFASPTPQKRGPTPVYASQRRSLNAVAV